MTVSSTTRKAGPFTGNGSQTAFPFSFKVFSASDVLVTRANTSGTESVLVLNSDYTVTLNSNQDSAPGGTVTLTSGLTLNYKLTVTGNTTYSQNTDLPTGGAYNAQNVEDALDRVTILTQQLAEGVGRALQVPVTSTQTADQLIQDLQGDAAAAAASAAAASASQSAAATSATNAATSASQAQNYVGNIINNPILGDDVFSGNGSTTAFTLARSMTAGTETALLVTISGVTQAPTAAYSVSGTTLTFTSAPPSGTNNIRVRYIGAMAVSAAAVDTAATAAAASASSASTSASTASTAATNAANSATSASTSAGTASTAATNAANSATSASTSASTATTQASNASTSASSAATSASNAATSATNAANSATSASGYLSSVATNATNAATSATNAANSATAAATSATNASNSATAAAGSASTASTQATNASNSASAASTSASNAATSATNAGASASAAAGSATSASTSAGNAAASATSASNSATAASGYLAPVTSTSSTSLTIGTGSKSLTIETGKQWVAGMAIKVAVTASPSTNYMTGTVTSYNSGTGALVVDVSAVGGSGTFSAWSLSLNAGSGGGGAALTTKLLRSKFLNSSGTYTPGPDVAAFYAQVYGATGGATGANLGGVGGPGYAEKYYPSPSGSYSYANGTGGTSSGTAGGTSTFDVMTVTGSAGVTTTAGGAGGVGSGGDFNATGGAGGASGGTSGGGNGGAGSRAGNGGTGATANNGGGGGTGGNNASGTSAGIGATAPSGSAIAMPWGNTEETFFSGLNGGASPGAGAYGVPILVGSHSNLYGVFSTTVNPQYLKPTPVSGTLAFYSSYPRSAYANTAYFGNVGTIVIIEVLK